MRFAPRVAVIAAILVLSFPGFAAASDSPSAQALAAAMSAYGRAVREGRVAKPGLLTLIDYTRPSTEPRLWVLDVLTGHVQFRELVAHGRNSGQVLPTAFSNADGTHMSSLGLFVTLDSYVGNNGYSLRLDGLDPGLNDHARRPRHRHPRRRLRESEDRRPAGTSGTQLGMPGRPDVGRQTADRSDQGWIGRLRVRQALRRELKQPNDSATSCVSRGRIRRDGLGVCVIAPRPRRRLGTGQADPQVAATVQQAMSTAKLPSIRWGKISDVAQKLTAIYARRARRVALVRWQRRPSPVLAPIVDALTHADDHGLDPADYDASTLFARVAAASAPGASPSDRAQRRSRRERAQ